MGIIELDAFLDRHVFSLAMMHKTNVVDLPHRLIAGKIVSDLVPELVLFHICQFSHLQDLLKFRTQNASNLPHLLFKLLDLIHGFDLLVARLFIGNGNVCDIKAEKMSVLVCIVC